MILSVPVPNIPFTIVIMTNSAIPFVDTDVQWNIIEHLRRNILHGLWTNDIIWLQVPLILGHIAGFTHVHIVHRHLVSFVCIYVMDFVQKYRKARPEISWLISMCTIFHNCSPFFTPSSELREYPTGGNPSPHPSLSMHLKVANVAARQLTSKLRW